MPNVRVIRRSRPVRRSLREPVAPPKRQRDRLTPRQLQCAALRARGLTIHAVLAELQIGPVMFYKHRAAAYTTFNVASEPELWTALGWLRVPEDVAA